MLVSPILDSNAPTASSPPEPSVKSEPLSPQEVSASAAQNDTHPAAPKSTDEIVSSARILVAEDNTPTRDFLQIFLTRSGYTVDLARNGDEAWRFLTAGDAIPGGLRSESNPPQAIYDLVISDWSMPGCDGMELTRRIRGHPVYRSVYLILVTANDGVNNMVEGLDGGADEYISKPFQPDELLARIKVGMRIRRLQQDVAAMEHQLAAVHLATSASHEINNPLMVLLGNLELLRKRVAPYQDPEIFKRLDAINKAAERIQRVATELKNLKKVKLTNYIRDVKMIDLSGKNQE